MALKVLVVPSLEALTLTVKSSPPLLLAVYSRTVQPSAIRALPVAVRTSFREALPYTSPVIARALSFTDSGVTTVPGVTTPGPTGDSSPVGSGLTTRISLATGAASSTSSTFRI